MTDSGDGENETLPISLKRMTSESFILGETREEKAKREKREMEIQRLLSETRKHHNALGHRLRDVKTYMNQEFQSGIATMEMYLLEGLRAKARQLRTLRQEVRVQKATLDADEEVKREEELVRWFIESETQLEKRMITAQIALEEFKSTANRLKAEVQNKRNEMKAIQLENAHLEHLLKRESLKSRNSQKNTQKLVLPEPVFSILQSISLMSELSSTQVGSLRLSELQGYKTLKDELWKVKTELKISRTEAKKAQIEQLSKVQQPLILKQLFNAGFEALLLIAMESKRAGNMELLSQSKRAFPSIKPLPHNSPIALEIVLQLFDRQEIFQILRDKVFPRHLRSLHSKKSVKKLPAASLGTSAIAPVSPGLFSFPDVSSLL